MQIERATRLFGQLALVAITSATVVGCTRKPLGGADGRVAPDGGSRHPGNEYRIYPQTIDKDVDILFVIDNSGSMEQEQTRLAKSAGASLIEPLRIERLGDKLPNVHIGVVSTDMGTGRFTSIPSCGVAGGDKGVLQNTPRQPGCKAPGARFISYIDGITNIRGCTKDKDPVECVKNSFSCISQLGTGGCGFESPLEAARAALDPVLNRNPGFLRKDALLAVVFITDEDDCSVKNSQLFDRSRTDLGPLSSFRCFEYGVECDGNKKRTDQGKRTGCHPGGSYLYPIKRYVDFFIKLKGGDRSRVLMAAISGPVTPVRVGVSASGKPVLKASCQSSSGFAVPAIRLKALVDAFGGQLSTICSGSYGPALKRLSDRISATLLGQCISSPLLLPSGGLACYAGVELGGGKKCSQSCLDEIECEVEEGLRDGAKTKVDKCPSQLFDPTVDACGSHCPCWRIVPRATCGSLAKSTPFAFQILRSADPPRGTRAVVDCDFSSDDWGSKEIAALPQCR